MIVKLRFYKTRLARASLPEIILRFRRIALQLHVARLVRKGRLPCSVPRLSPAMLTSFALPALRGSVDGDLVEDIMAGKRFTLNADPEAISLFEEARRFATADQIRLFQQASVDIRTVWEPARLQHLTVLFAWLQREKGAEAPGIKEFSRNEVLAWLQGNPFLYGPHYLSAMECALRIPVFCYALKLLDNLEAQEYSQLLEGVYLHAWWIVNNLSLHSSLGNHTVSEAVGLVFAGTLFRETACGRKWLQQGLSLLDQEFAHQILADGGPVEQSFSYHRLVLDLYWLAIEVLEKNGIRQCDDFRAGLAQGEKFLAAFGGVTGDTPAIGDCDDGHALGPGIHPHRIVPPAARQSFLEFAASGYTVFKLPGDGLLTFDHGPLGMAPLYNHGHADALSVTLSLAGLELLVDPGTYRYNGEAAYRRYFKSTAAHNTVTVDGRDQAVQETGFVWSHPFACRVLRREQHGEGYLLEAEHDGYRRLREPVLHRRALLYDARGFLMLKDSFSGAGHHEFALHFHLHPDAAVSRESGWCCISREGSRIRLKLLGGDDFELVQGQEAPIIGWYSPRYGIKRPSCVLRSTRQNGCDTAEFRTLIALEGCPESLVMEALGGTL
jgi:hypothetical protein